MNTKSFCYIGNWGKDSASIGYTICSYDAEKGTLAPLGTAYEGLSVGAHVVDTEKGLLYTADEKADYPGMRQGGGGEVHCFAIDAATGHLMRVSSLPSYGAMASYAARDARGEFLLVTNHGSRNYVTHVVREENGSYRQEVLHDDATMALYRLNTDGSIAGVCDVYYASGSGPAPQQVMPHLHSVVGSPDGSFFLVCDKGGDQLLTFTIDRENARIIPLGEPAFRAEPGSAPRYSSFHPTLPVVYTNNELKPILYCLRYDQTGALTLMQKISGFAGPIESEEKGMQSALHVSADGRFLYSLVRNPDVISVYRIDQTDGTLSPLQLLRTQAKNLRGAALSPDGRYLLVAAIDSHQVLSYPIKPDGTLGEAVCAIDQPTPCCIAFYPDQ